LHKSFVLGYCKDKHIIQNNIALDAKYIQILHILKHFLHILKVAPGKWEPNHVF